MAMTLARVLPGWSLKRDRRVDAMERLCVPALLLIFGSGYCLTRHVYENCTDPGAVGWNFIDAGRMGAPQSEGTAGKSSHGVRIRRPKGMSCAGAFHRMQCGRNRAVFLVT
jgi:hypothetical protein